MWIWNFAGSLRKNISLINQVFGGFLEVTFYANKNKNEPLLTNANSTVNWSNYFLWYNFFPAGLSLTTIKEFLGARFGI
jgi:hypothetical protein